jgi:acyl dehydratase
MTLPVHTVRAYNDAAASANKIHDDTVAAQYGFRGGLVPGVTVYAYMTYPLVQSFGEAWLTRGTANVRFVRPFYEGDQVTVSGTIRAVSGPGLDLDMRGTNAAGVDCGLGTATLPARAALASAEVPAGPAQQRRIPISSEAIVVGVPLPKLTLTVSQAENQEYCQTHGDDLAVYQGAQGCVHPGLLLRQCNRIFSEHFVLGPWIHVASEVTTYRPCRAGEALEVRGVPIDKFEKKGHGFVVLDVGILANGAMAQRVKHTCIFRPRKD